MGGTRAASCSPVPPAYLIRTAEGSIDTGADTFFTAKEARCFQETALGSPPPTGTSAKTRLFTVFHILMVVKNHFLSLPPADPIPFVHA